MSILGETIRCDFCAHEINMAGAWLRIARTSVNPATGRNRLWLECETCAYKRQAHETAQRIVALELAEQREPTRATKAAAETAAETGERRMVIAPTHLPDVG